MVPVPQNKSMMTLLGRDSTPSSAKASTSAYSRSADVGLVWKKDPMLMPNDNPCNTSVTVLSPQITRDLPSRASTRSPLSSLMVCKMPFTRSPQSPRMQATKPSTSNGASEVVTKLTSRASWAWLLRTTRKRKKPSRLGGCQAGSPVLSHHARTS